MARQFKSSINIEQTFAPTSMRVVPKMLIHLLLNVCREFVAMTLDIKDACLMADQPKEEKAYVNVDNVIYKLNKLVKCLPGQRNAPNGFSCLQGQRESLGLSKMSCNPPY